MRQRKPLRARPSNMATGVAKEAFKTAGAGMAKAATKTTTGSARKTAAKRAAPKK